MFDFLPVMLAISYAQPARGGGWYSRLALLDSVIALVVVSWMTSPFDRSGAMAAGWLFVEGVWLCRRFHRERQGPIRRGGGVRVAIALVLAAVTAGILSATLGAATLIAGPAATMLIGLAAAAAATTSEDRLGSLLVANGGLLLACRDTTGAGLWGLVPVLLVRGILLGMLEWERSHEFEQERPR